MCCAPSIDGLWATDIMLLVVVQLEPCLHVPLQGIRFRVVVFCIQ